MIFTTDEKTAKKITNLIRWRNKDFREYIKKYGFKIHRVLGRDDIRSVTYRNTHLFTCPAGIRNENTGTDINGLRHPSYDELCRKADAWNVRVKKTNFLKEYYEE